MLGIEPAAAAPSGWLPWTVAGVAAILGGGGVTALLRSGKEGSRILVDAAQGAVVVQSGVITTLREDLQSAHAEIAELRAHMAEISGLRGKISGLEQENEQLRGENEQLRERVRRLERDAGIAGPP